MTKATYERPQLVEFGTIDALTKAFKKLGGSDGVFLIQDDGTITGMHWVSPP